MAGRNRGYQRYELLVELSVNAGRVLTFDTLLDRVWGVGGDTGALG